MAADWKLTTAYGIISLLPDDPADCDEILEYVAEIRSKMANHLPRRGARGRGLSAALGRGLGSIRGKGGRGVKPGRSGASKRGKSQSGALLGKPR